MIAAKNTSWLSRIPAGWKFGTLLAISISLYLISFWQVLLALLLVSIATLVSARVDFKQLRMPLVTLAAILAVVLILLGIQTGWRKATIAVSLTTSFDAMLELFQKVASPLRVLGANPAQIALALSMAIRFIPELKRVYLEVREAQHARGLGNNPLAVSVPLVIRSLKIADETAEALDARGYDSAPARHHRL